MAKTDAPPPEALRRMFEIATEIKQTDERFRGLLLSGQIRCTYYSPRGQEVISAAFGTVLRRDDYVVTTYRGLHDHLAKGVSQRELWAEFLGRSTGTCKGKGGPMHITDPKSGLMVTTGIVGSGMPIANGLALASTLRGTDQVTIVNFGDGASNIGAFHEALNLAAVWKLPVVFVCQNNQYAEHTRYEDGTSAKRICDRALAYGMPGETVDGNDAPEMYGAAVRAVERARSGDGPTLIDAHTYRFWGHIFGDDMAYMPTEEREAAMANDPVPQLRALLIELGIAAEEELAEVEVSIEKAIDDAVEFALASPPPGVDELLVDIYAEAVTA